MKTKLLILLAFFSISVKAQIVETSQKKKPVWFSEKPETKNYKYYIGLGENASLEDAKNMAINDVLRKISQEAGVKIKEVSR